jgi:hypothetical protein
MKLGYEMILFLHTRKAEGSKQNAAEAGARSLAGVAIGANRLISLVGAA